MLAAVAAVSVLFLGVGNNLGVVGADVGVVGGGINSGGDYCWWW